jgi:hypothetical protein
MMRRLLKPLALVLPLLWAAASHAQLPRGDLSVELRQIEAQPGTTYSTQLRTPALTPQMVQVKNGEKATLRMGQAMPVKWLQSAAVQSGRSDGAAVSYGLVWMEAGQAFSVTPRWPGGKQAVAVQIEVASASVDASTGAELPSQQRSQLSTTVSAPLGEWVTVAASGGEVEQKGVYSSRSAGDIRQLIQLRVQSLSAR